MRLLKLRQKVLYITFALELNKLTITFHILWVMPHPHLTTSRPHQAPSYYSHYAAAHPSYRLQYTYIIYNKGHISSHLNPKSALSVPAT